MPANPALDAALALARSPTLVHAMRQQPLPAGIATLLRLVAGEVDVVDDPIVHATQRSDVHVAAELYVQQVLLYAGAPPHRMLGVSPDASRAEMRTHLRWLMTWLHPDKSGGDWRSAFAGRVLAAWQELSTAPQLATSPRVSRPASATAGPVAPLSKLRPAAVRAPRLPWVIHPLDRKPVRRRRVAGPVVLVSLCLLLLALVLSMPGSGPSDLLATWLGEGAPRDNMGSGATPPDGLARASQIAPAGRGPTR